ncbi:modulator of FtsH protease HflK [Peptococcaceae bacterium CEB3]|nr:modulator of FtsH protease HflK [Peptococcaceae bacterium CEB3]
MYFTIILVVLILAALAVVIKNIQIVPQGYAYVVERLGAYKETWDVGLHIKMPFLERIVRKVSIKEQVIEFEPQAVITKDNVLIKIDTVMYYMITDTRDYAYGVEKPIMAIEKMTETTLRSIVGDMEFDHILTLREQINTRLRETVDTASNNWGIKLVRAEIRNVIAPDEIRNALEKQMQAERQKRATILTAEATKQAAILTAEGNKQAVILNAEAERDAQILRAEAVKQSRIIEAQGQAEAIAKIQQAASNGSKEFLAIRGLEALERAANGQATKVIIPAEMQNIAAISATLKEIVA